jgi:putative glycosyltransferase (TIGR04348 family)
MSARALRIPPVVTALLVQPSEGAGGNRTTALRWARILRGEGWRVVRPGARVPQRADLIIALHARKTRAQVNALRVTQPDAALVVAATGTDLYVDLPAGGDDAQQARAGLAAADRIVVLQERALEALPAELRDRARVVHQSLAPPAQRPQPNPDRFEVVLLAGLRPIKDPLLVPHAARALPTDSRVHVVHLGPGLDPQLTREALQEERTNHRYRWLGALPRREALCHLMRARLLVSPSRQEGGANVLTEAFACGTPVLASRIDGSVGLLGEDHPGLFPAGDAPALTTLLNRSERDPDFLEHLARRSRELAWMADPIRERDAWRALLRELNLGNPA